MAKKINEEHKRFYNEYKQKLKNRKGEEKEYIKRKYSKAKVKKEIEEAMKNIKDLFNDITESNLDYNNKLLLEINKLLELNNLKEKVSVSSIITNE